jgi:hypothetical protein
VSGNLEATIRYIEDELQTLRDTLFELRLGDVKLMNCDGMTATQKQCFKTLQKNLGRAADELGVAYDHLHAARMQCGGFVDYDISLDNGRSKGFLLSEVPHRRKDHDTPI